MTRRSRNIRRSQPVRRESLAPALFPFLAVFACGFGALIPVFASIVGQSQETAKSTTSQTKESKASEDHLRFTSDETITQHERLQFDRLDNPEEPFRIEGRVAELKEDGDRDQKVERDLGVVGESPNSKSAISPDMETDPLDLGQVQDEQVALGGLGLPISSDNEKDQNEKVVASGSDEQNAWAAIDSASIAPPSQRPSVPLQSTFKPQSPLVANTDPGISQPLLYSNDTTILRQMPTNSSFPPAVDNVLVSNASVPGVNTNATSWNYAINTGTNSNRLSNSSFVKNSTVFKWQGGAGANPIPRSLRLVATTDRWLVMHNDAADRIEATITFENGPEAARNALYQAIDQQVDSWGTPTPNGYWKPTLTIEVREQAELSVLRLQKLLEGSDLQYQLVPVRNPN